MGTVVHPLQIIAPTTNHNSPYSFSCVWWVMCFKSVVAHLPLLRPPLCAKPNDKFTAASSRGVDCPVLKLRFKEGPCVFAVTPQCKLGRGGSNKTASAPGERSHKKRREREKERKKKRKRGGERVSTGVSTQAGVVTSWHGLCSKAPARPSGAGAHLRVQSA